MPGGWSLSMIWMRMPGQSWPGAAAAFVGMWTVMMVAMMLPSLVPVLLRHRQVPGRAAVLIVGYFFVWASLGALVFAVGATLAAVEMREAEVARAVPLVGAAVVVIAAAFHVARWMSRNRASGRDARLRGLTWPAGTGATGAWRYGLRLGIDSAYCCSSLMMILLVVGLMDLRAMGAATVAITVERYLMTTNP